MKTFITFLNRNKLFTFVNVLGLSLSLMFVLLIANLVKRQFTVDSQVTDAERISLFACEHFVGGHYNLGDKLQSRYPEIEDWSATSPAHTLVVKVGDTNFELNSLIVRNNFFSFFGYRLREGKATDVLRDANKVVLTRKGALKLFGTEQAVGKTLLYTLGEYKGVYEVSGIADDFDNSIFPDQTDAIFPYEIMEYVNWGSSIKATHMNNAAGAELFIKTPQNVDMNAKRQEVIAYLKTVYWLYSNDAANDVSFVPMKRFYFSELKDYNGLNQYAYNQLVIYIIAGLLILLMAVFNYISMSFALTSYRAKEMATRRLLGSSKKDIFWRMIVESFLLTLVAFLLGFLLAKVFESVVSELFESNLDLLGDLTLGTVAIYLLFISLLAFLSGLFPALLLSNYKPMDVVKGTFRRKTKAIYLRLLNIFQSGLTMALLTGALFMTSLFFFLLHSPLGYQYDNILTLTPVLDDGGYRTFRNELTKLSFVKEISFSDGLMINGGQNNTQSIVDTHGGPSRSMSFEMLDVDSAFVKMFGIRILQDLHLQNDRHTWFFSEKTVQAAHELGYTDFVVTSYDDKYIIGGMIGDVKIQSMLHQGSEYVLMRIHPNDSINNPGGVCVQVEPGRPAEYKKQIEAVYAKLANGQPFEARWYSDIVKEAYRPALQQSKTIWMFTFSALVISLLGLTAMSIYFIAQRRRDMAIRKVFGSTNRLELFSLLKFTLMSLCFSLVIAVPLMVYGIRKLGQVVTIEGGYSCPLWVPLAAIAFVVFVSLASVYFICRKAASENPVNHLKTE